MRSTSYFADQQRTKYIELWVYNGLDEEDSTRINIDIGQISEDWYLKYYDQLQDTILYGGSGNRGRRRLDNEDQNNNGLLEEDEDTGIDGYPNGHPGDIGSEDDWRQPDQKTGNYSGLNGTEGNSRARGQIYPDTEDLDGDGRVDLNNEYFTYSFTLHKDDENREKLVN